MKKAETPCKGKTGPPEPRKGKRGPFQQYATIAPPPNPDGDIAVAAKAEFGRRLQLARLKKNWNQSDLSRAATQMLPPAAPGQRQGHEIGRDLVSNYERGRILPRPVYLAALAKALGVEPKSLLPEQALQAAQNRAESVPFELRSIDAHRSWLRVNRSVSTPIAMKILQLLADEDHEEK